MLIGVSTGVLYKYIDGVNPQIDFFRNSGAEIDGLEISLGSADVRDCLAISKDNEKYLRQLNFTSIHLPWKNVEYESKETPEIMHISELYHQLNCRVAVIHPDCVKDIETYKFLLKLFPGLSIENMTPRKSTGHLIEHIKKITDKNANLGVVLDFAHCMESSEPFESYEAAFGDRISEIHISASKKALYNDHEGSSHMALHKTEILPQIRKRNVPFIIEGKVSTAEELEKEINFVRQL